MRVLVGVEPFNLEVIVQRHIEDGAKGRGAVEIDGLFRHELEEVSPEAIAAERAELERYVKAARRMSAELN